MLEVRSRRSLIAVLVLLSAALVHPAQLAAEQASKGPKLVMIIRHAEKPDATTDGEKDPNLSKQGFERAAALAKVIPDHFVKPDYLIATKKTKGSERPIETITPLSKAIDEPIDSQWSDNEYADVAKAVMTDPKYDGKIVLIAWHHGKIPELAKAFGVTTAPAKWNSAIFDRVWEITFDDGKATMKDLPQKALPGDEQQ